MPQKSVNGNEHSTAAPGRAEIAETCSGAFPSLADGEPQGIMSARACSGQSTNRSGSKTKTAIPRRRLGVDPAAVYPGSLPFWV
jgi:hypothetical protein